MTRIMVILPFIAQSVYSFAHHVKADIVALVLKAVHAMKCNAACVCVCLRMCITARRQSRLNVKKKPHRSYLCASQQINEVQV